MPFTVRKRESYRWTVEHLLSMRDGKPDEMLKFDVEFKALSAKEAEDAINGIKSDPDSPWTFCERVLVGWHDAPHGWEFSIEKLKELCDFYPGLTGSLLRAFMASLGVAAQKN